MNMAIFTERARAEEKKDNKRKFMEHKAQQQECSFPEEEKLRSPHVQVPSPHALQNPVTSHGLSGP
jgi:hypothetical protein